MNQPSLPTRTLNDLPWIIKSSRAGLTGSQVKDECSKMLDTVLWGTDVHSEVMDYHVVIMENSRRAVLEMNSDVSVRNLLPQASAYRILTLTRGFLG
jgi:hypothetical protein